MFKDLVTMNIAGGASSSFVDCKESMEQLDLDPVVSSIDEIQSELTIDSKKRKQRTPSPVWTQFDEVVVKNEDGTNLLDDNGKVVMKACCRICKEKYVFGGTHGMNHLYRHMSSCLKRNNYEGSQSIVGKTKSGDVYYFSFAKRKLTIKL